MQQVPSAVVKSMEDLAAAVKDLMAGRIAGRWTHRMVAGRPTGEPGESVVLIEGSITLGCGSTAQVAIRISGSQLSAQRAAEAVYVAPRSGGGGDAAERRAAAMAARDAALAASRRPAPVSAPVSAAATARVRR
jgi:hypothetical protein